MEDKCDAHNQFRWHFYPFCERERATASIAQIQCCKRLLFLFFVFISKTFPPWLAQWFISNSNWQWNWCWQWAVAVAVDRSIQHSMRIAQCSFILSLIPIKRRNAFVTNFIRHCELVLSNREAPVCCLPPNHWQTEIWSNRRNKYSFFGRTSYTLKHTRTSAG